MGVGDRVLEVFGVEDEFGDLVMPKDVHSCTYCGYIGHGWINHICPKCKKPSLINEMVKKNKKEFTDSVRTDWAEKNILKQISEMWVANKYRNEGYKVAKASKYDYISNSTIPDEEQIKRLLEGYDKKDKVLNLLKNIWVGLPDLIRLKDNKISFVEVKSNGSSIKEKQQEALKNLENNGYGILVIWVDVKYTVDNYREFSVKDLKINESWNGDIYFK